MHSAYADFKDDIITAGNEYYELKIGCKEKINPFFLNDKISGMKYADADYQYLIRYSDAGNRTELVSLQCGSYAIKDADKGKEIVLTGISGPFKIMQKFLINPVEPWFEESLTVENCGQNTLCVETLGFGFRKKILDGTGNPYAGIAEYRIVAIPYRRAVADGKMEDYSLQDLLSKRGWQRYSWPGEPVPADEFSSEGWVWTDGEKGLLLIKYSQD